MTGRLNRLLAVLLITFLSISLGACRSGSGSSGNPLIPGDSNQEIPQDDEADDDADGNGDEDSDSDIPDQGETDELAITHSRLPSGVPPAAFADERERESALDITEENQAFWPFEVGAPRTSGTGRYAHGAFYWTDFIYDADGAIGLDLPIHRIGTPTGGTMVYPDEARTANNGADIFRVGIGADESFTYWRVDWQTLRDESVPIAAFALDYNPTDGSGGFLPITLDDLSFLLDELPLPVGGLSSLVADLPLPTDTWPAVPRLLSPDIEAVLLISSDGVFLATASGTVEEIGSVAVDMNARSFLARIPRSNLPPLTGAWRLRLASGLNDGNGRFLDDMTSFRGLPTQSPVFNLAFRNYQHEPAANNFWFNQTQALHLTISNATPFFVDLDWSRLGETEPEPVVHGYSNRWYVSSVDPDEQFGGDGIAPGSTPQYRDRVQPYGIYVPTTYDPEAPEPMLFTLMLHSLTQNHNQYGATLPNFQQEGCEQRNSICVTTLGRGPDGWYVQDAELDLWEAWHNVARFFPLDPQRSITSGYSMGSGGSYLLATRYPDVFAGAVFLAGQPGFGQINATAMLENLKWTGYYQAHGTFDQLVPFPDAQVGADTMEDLGYRYTFDHYLAEDHVVWSLKDGAYSAFGEAARWMQALTSEGARKQSPGDFVYRWRASQVFPALGIGPGTSVNGPWWLSELKAAAGATESAVRAQSSGRPEIPVGVDTLTPAPLLSPDIPSPAIRREQQWIALDDKPSVAGKVELLLEGVEQLRVDMENAGVANRSDKLLCLDTDTPATIILHNLEDGLLVSGPGGIGETVVGGEAGFTIGVGTQAISFSDSTVTADEALSACGFD